MTISEIIAVLREKFPSVEVSYLHPALYIFLIDQRFEGVSGDEREAMVAKITGISMIDVHKKIGLDLILCTEEERGAEYDFIPSPDVSNHWLPLMDYENRISWKAQRSSVRAIHFYGYKGGQARSTILGMLAKQCANDGLKVLLVDADLEAPSLAKMFDTPIHDASQTLLGVSFDGADVNPIEVFQSAISEGSVSLISARPDDSKYDLDYACFLTQATVNIDLLMDLIGKIQNFCEMSGNFDVVFFDHRTGLSASVLPIISRWAGSVVIAARTDGLSLEASSIYTSLFGAFPENPGLFVSFSLDPSDPELPASVRAEIEDRMLLPLAEAIERGALDVSGEDVGEQIPTEALYSYFIRWPHEQNFIKKNLPDIEDVSYVNQQAIRNIRDSLELKTQLVAPVKLETSSPSGAEDEVVFLETPNVAKVFNKNSPYTYVLGRKGTGKTRIFSELIKAKIGRPLFAPPDLKYPAIKSQTNAVDRIKAKTGKDFEFFWWSLFWINLHLSDSASEADINEKIESWEAMSDEIRASNCSSFGVSELLNSLEVSQHLTYLIDGVETAVVAGELTAFVDALLRVLATVQYDPMLSKYIKARLFLRSDLMSASSQNLEQQTAGRKIELSWDQDSIFNFLLARIQSNSWFKNKFPAVCGKIKNKLDVIRKGGLQEDEYKSLILEIFPEKLRRNNIQTFTFLTTYFSDVGGDSSKRTAFYPRLFENFTAELGRMAEDAGQDAIHDGRVRHSLVLEAHKVASELFLNQIKQELYISLKFSDSKVENESKIDAFLESFQGMATPFVVEELSDLISKTIGESKNLVRAALNKLKELGFFETRPGFKNQWRTGQLYKSALGMKYVRGQKQVT